jgi:hypothetical protein
VVTPLVSLKCSVGGTIPFNEQTRSYLYALVDWLITNNHPVYMSSISAIFRTTASSIIYKQIYLRMRDGWKERGNGYWMPLDKYGDMGRDYTFSVLYNSNTLYWNVQKFKSTRSVACCKHFGPRSGFPYYNVRTPHREGFPYPPPVLSYIPQSYTSSVVQISPNYNNSYSIRFLPVVYLSVWLNVFGLMCAKYFISIQVRCI